MKRILAIAMTLCLALSFTAFAQAEEGLSGTIRYSTWGAIIEKEINEAIIAAFMEENPGCTVELEYIPSGYTQAIDTMFLGGNAPDVIYGHPHYFVSWAANDLLMNLDDMFEEDHDYFYDDKFAVGMYEDFKYEGHHVATINGHDTFLLFYNKDLFDKAGVAYPTAEWTWDDFVEAGKKLTILDGENKQYAMSFSWPQAIIYSFGGRYFDSMSNPTEVLFNSPDTVAALQFISDCIYEHKIAPETVDSELMGGTFATGRLAMDITGAWGIAENWNIEAFEWDVCEVPLREGYPRTNQCFVAGYAVNADTKNPELAKAFAKYFQSDRAQTLLNSLGLITVINKDIAGNEEILNAEGQPEHAAIRVTTIDDAINGYASLTNYLEMLSEVINPGFDRLITAHADPATVAQEIHDGMNKLLAEAQ